MQDEDAGDRAGTPRSEERLRALIAANRLLVDELDVESVLTAVIRSAVELVDAPFGVLGVFGSDGGIERVLQVGGPADLAAMIDRHPEGRELLGTVIDRPNPVRVETALTGSDGTGRTVPGMVGALGVPIRVRGETFGNLYLREPADGRFSLQDEELLVGLAATAGVAIDNARLFEEARRRERWSAASAQIAASLLSGRDDALSTIAETTAHLADAEVVCVVLPLGDDRLVVDRVGGTEGERFRSLVLPREGSVTAHALDSGAPVRRDRIGAYDTGVPDAPILLGPSMVIPLIADEVPIGALAITRLADRPRFSESDLELAVDFADQCAIALSLDRGRADRERLAVLEDRGRIARDLHDQVIQRLFGAGLTLQALGSEIDDARLRERVEDQVTALDEAIGSIRTAIFALTSRRSTHSVKHRIMDVVTAHEGTDAPTPRLLLTGPIDSTVGEDLVDDVLAVVREGIANVARHAAASHTTVSVAAERDRLVVRIEDDGVGVNDGGPARRSGTANLDERAARHGGASTLTPRRPTGSVLEWVVPLASTTGRRS